MSLSLEYESRSSSTRIKSVSCQYCTRNYFLTIGKKVSCPTQCSAFC